MPKLEIKIPHNLTTTEALTRIQQFLPGLKAQHSDKISNLEETWSGNTGKFKFKISGFKVIGSVTLETNYVLINGDSLYLLKARLKPLLTNKFTLYFIN